MNTKAEAWWENMESATMVDFNRLKEDASGLLKAAKEVLEWANEQGVTQSVARRINKLNEVVAKAEGRA